VSAASHPSQLARDQTDLLARPSQNPSPRRVFPAIGIIFLLRLCARGLHCVDLDRIELRATQIRREPRAKVLAAGWPDCREVKTVHDETYHQRLGGQLARLCASSVAQLWAKWFAARDTHGLNLAGVTS
jgi:hypothetical protein